MLGADVVVIELPRFLIRQVDDPLGARRELHVLAQVAVAARDLLLDVGADAAERHAQPFQDAGGHAVVLADQAEQQVLGAHVVLAQARRFFLGEEDDPPRSSR